MSRCGVLLLLGCQLGACDDGGAPPKRAPALASPSIDVPGSSGAAGAGGAAVEACNRDCLIDVLTTYLDALAANDPTRVATTRDVRFTENGVVGVLGSGLWRTATAIVQSSRLDFADPLERQVGSQLLVEEAAAPVLFQVRLKLEGREVSEIETIAMRQGDGLGFNPAGMIPNDLFRQAVPLEQRASRAVLRATTERYLDALESGDFSATPFDARVVRMENGMQTADYTWFAQRVGGAPTGRSIVRRYLAFDEEYGLVFGIFPFSDSANAMVASEVFKVQDGKILVINVVLTTMPTRVWPLD